MNLEEEMKVVSSKQSKPSALSIALGQLAHMGSDLEDLEDMNCDFDPDTLKSLSKVDEEEEEMPNLGMLKMTSFSSLKKDYE
jgi:hypothetical protein